MRCRLAYWRDASATAATASSSVMRPLGAEAPPCNRWPAGPWVGPVERHERPHLSTRPAANIRPARVDSLGQRSRRWVEHHQVVSVSGCPPRVRARGGPWRGGPPGSVPRGGGCEPRAPRPLGRPPRARPPAHPDAPPPRPAIGEPARSCLPAAPWADPAAAPAGRNPCRPPRSRRRPQPGRRLWRPRPSARNRPPRTARLALPRRWWCGTSAARAFGLAVPTSMPTYTCMESALTM